MYVKCTAIYSAHFQEWRLSWSWMEYMSCLVSQIFTVGVSSMPRCHPIITGRPVVGVTKSPYDNFSMWYMFSLVYIFLKTLHTQVTKWTWHLISKWYLMILKMGNNGTGISLVIPTERPRDTKMFRRVSSATYVALVTWLCNLTPYCIELDTDKS